MPEMLSPEARRGLRVLLVEDDPATSAALSAILRMYGHQVKAAASVHASVSLLEQQSGDPFDAMILDLMLPDGDGSTVLSVLRRLEAHGGAHTRVHVTTASTDPDRLSAVEAMRPDSMLSKPVDLATLLERL